MRPAEQIAREALSAWEQAAGKLSESLVRDPRTLELGAAWLRASLTWKKASDEVLARAWDQSIAAWRALGGGR